MFGIYNEGTSARLIPLIGASTMLALALSGVVHASVPDLDRGTGSSGVALLVGGALFLVERYRRQR